MKRKFLSFTLAVLMLTSCGKTDDPVEDTTPHFYDFGLRNYGEGSSYTVSAANGTKTMYIDYDTMEKTALCAVPNCNHTTSSCLAVQAVYPVIVGDCVYYFLHFEGMKEYPEGVRFEMDSRLMRASLDNSEAEVICEFSDAIPRNEETLVTANGKLYFIGYDPDVEVDEYGASSVKTGGGFEYLCSIDLTSGDYSNYGLICYVEDEYPAADNSSSAYISGVDNGKLYITYSFTKELFDPVNDPGALPEWTFYNFEFDLETEQYTESALPAVLCAAEGVYAWYDGKLHVIKNGDEHIIDCTYFISNATILNDKLFVNGGWIELSDMTIHYFDEKHKDYSVIAYYDGCYIMTYGNYLFEKLTEEELLSLEKEVG